MTRRGVRAESRARYFIREIAAARGWNTGHCARGGDFLEENEIEAHFPGIGLAGTKPDFVVTWRGDPIVVVEAKNDASKLDQASREAKDYVDQIWAAGKHKPRIAVGAAGEEDRGFLLEIWFRSLAGWTPLKSNGQSLTSFPTSREVELATLAADGTTTVSIPQSAEFIDAAVEVSALLRRAKIEAPLRPKVIGALTLALYEGDIRYGSPAIETVNELIDRAIQNSVDLSIDRKSQLIDALKLSHADFDRLVPYISRLVAILRALNIRSVLHSDTDFLGLFYEAFLRYGYDNNALGIVFTPRHITRLCVELTGIDARDRAIDIACGTGGFLVAAFDAMIRQARSSQAIEKVKRSLTGVDANPTVWSLAMLNMFFRGDGKTHVVQGDSLSTNSLREYEGQFTRSFLNPPFSQDEEPEYRFIDNAAAALEPEGRLAAVVYAGVFADEDHQAWRRAFLTKHRLLGMVSLPDDLFYPTAAPTTIMLAEAHVPQQAEDDIFMAKIWNDGFAKLKGRRVDCPGSEIPEIERAFDEHSEGRHFDSPIATAVKGAQLLHGDEWSPQKWLSQPPQTEDDLAHLMSASTRSLLQAVAKYPEVADSVLPEFTRTWNGMPALPLDARHPLSFFFEIKNGRSSGEKNYRAGDTPYVSSGDAANSIVGLKGPDEDQLFGDGGLTVTAFGTACVQPWPFLARGNGGSSVRVLVPRYSMSESDLLWFAAQINSQRWRFFYARMAIKGRISNLIVNSPPHRLSLDERSLADRIKSFSESIDRFSSAPRSTDA